MLTFLLAELKEDDIRTRAQSMSFSFFLAIFPSIIVLFTAIAYLPLSGQEEVLFNELQEFMPSDAGTFIYDTVNDLIQIPRGGLLSIGFILAIVFSSNGMITMMKGFEKSYELTFKKRGFIAKRLIAIWLTFLLGVLLLLSVSLIILSKYLLNDLLAPLQLDKISPFLLHILRWTVIILLFYSVLTSIYRFGPPLKEKFGPFTPGATLATILSIMSSLAFSYFIDNFGSYNKIYGSIGALIVTLIWLEINCFVILVGFELNASIAINRDLKSLD